MLLVVAALAMKALMPAGFMVSSHSQSFSVVMCSGMGEVTTVTIPFDDDGKSAPVADKQPCHAAGLDKAASGTVDPVLLTAALAFVLLLGFSAATLPGWREPRFRQPPLRGPPSTA